MKKRDVKFIEKSIETLKIVIDDLTLSLSGNHPKERLLDSACELSGMAQLLYKIHINIKTEMKGK